MGLSGSVFVATAVIVLGYMVPHLVRVRSMKVDSRVNDRFSQALRLVEVRVSEPHSGNSATMIHASGKQRTEALAMIRPTVPSAARVNARELAASRAACAADISRRAASARRRTVVLTFLAVATIAVGILGATSVLHAAFVVIPAVLLVGAGYLSAQAEKYRRVADARSRSHMHRFDQRLSLFRSREVGTLAPEPAPQSFDEVLTGGAHAPKILPDAEPRHSRVTADVDERTADERSESRRAVRESTSWMPVQVPAPTYTLKQDAPRRAVAPAKPDTTDVGLAVPDRPTHTVTARHEVQPDAAPTPVDMVLARRRAAGM